MRIDYQCASCSLVRPNSSMTSMLCECGGDMKALGTMFGNNLREFVPYYDTVLRSTVTSFRDQDKKMARHKTPSHPEGLVRFSDDHKQMAECRNIRRNKEDWKKANWPGYRIGEKKYDPTGASRKPSGRLYFHAA